MGKFKPIKITNLKDLGNTEELPESDFSVLVGEKFLQYKYIEEDEKVQVIKVKPGIFELAVVDNELKLLKTEFSDEAVMQEYIQTEHIKNKIDLFFSKQAVYKKHKIQPKRAMLLWGTPGTGKTQLISTVAKEYDKNDDTLILLWKTDVLKAKHVSGFLKTVDYGKKVKRLVIIAEDIGGAEVDMVGQRYADSSLLALLDNMEKVFRIPTMILATTNYPQNLLPSLTNRPSRFDDMIEVEAPNAQFRAKFLEFFSKNSNSQEDEAYIMNAKFNGFTVAHIKEVVIRSELYDISYHESMDQLLAQSAKSVNNFENRGRLGV